VLLPAVPAPAVPPAVDAAAGFVAGVELSEQPAIDAPAASSAKMKPERKSLRIPAIGRSRRFF
jgi:hypothetical protein